MANMSYCQFENTVSDLEDCWDNFDVETSREENRARQRLIKLCHEIARNYNPSYSNIDADEDDDDE